jgi:hypothetical protein
VLNAFISFLPRLEAAFLLLGMFFNGDSFAETHAWLPVLISIRLSSTGRF